MAIGKHGTKPVPLPLIPSLHSELSSPSPSPALLLQRASFLAALFVKQTLLPAEHALLHAFTHSPQHISGRARELDGVRVTAGEVLAAVSVTASPLRSFAERLLDGERLSLVEARALGGLLYSPGGDVNLKALVAHVMRVRHESDEELAGLCLAAAGGVSTRFTHLRGADGGVYVHIAEPFDGTVTSDLVTPLLGRWLLARGLLPVLAVGESSGPKYGPNLRDVGAELGMARCASAEDVVGQFRRGVEYGVLVDQSDAHAGLAEWVALRRTIVKRPAVATAEKYVDACPEQARVFVASAFHAAYVGKMARACEAAGYRGYVIVGKGMEGTTGLGVKARRSAELVVGWRGGDGYERESVVYAAKEDGLECEQEEARNEATARRTAERIRRFVTGEGHGRGHGNGDVFAKRVACTLKGFEKAFAILEREGVV